MLNTVMAKTPQNRVEILNISQTNGKGEVVINDQKLLELIQAFPFLYDIQVRPYQDPDYDEWAWTSIATSFNRIYEGTNTSFSASELRARWDLLYPLVRSLHNLPDKSSIPESLRQAVDMLHVSLEERSQPQQSNVTEAQTVILTNISLIQRLPLKQRQLLEAELLDLILSAELEAKATVKFGDDEWKRVETECAEFVEAIKLPDLLVAPPNENHPMKVSSIVIDLDDNSSINGCFDNGDQIFAHNRDSACDAVQTQAISVISDISSPPLASKPAVVDEAIKEKSAICKPALVRSETPVAVVELSDAEPSAERSLQGETRATKPDKTSMIKSIKPLKKKHSKTTIENPSTEEKLFPKPGYKGRLILPKVDHAEEHSKESVTSPAQPSLEELLDSQPSTSKKRSPKAKKSAAPPAKITSRRPNAEDEAPVSRKSKPVTAPPARIMMRRQTMFKIGDVQEVSKNSHPAQKRHAASARRSSTSAIKSQMPLQEPVPAKTAKITKRGQNKSKTALKSKNTQANSESSITPETHWVPLQEAHRHVRRCVVRIRKCR